MKGVRHYVKCRCILQQFLSQKDPPQHRFEVFSVVDNADNVVHSYAQCDNCGVIHKIIEICGSEIMHGSEDLKLKTIDDIKLGLPDKISGLLEANSCSLPAWQHAAFILENKRWGDVLILSVEQAGDIKTTKYATIIGESLLKVDTHVSQFLFKV